MYQNENLFTMRLILPQIYWISKKKKKKKGFWGILVYLSLKR
ncbi:hypothetical protein HPOKI112_03445 [Helicobacter pylori oki112]|nr:hypothetical protein HPOKI112_03445 [Helicobacter pylori oki112]